MRKALRVRGLMAAVAIFAIGLTWVAGIWRRGEFAFQRYHADLAAFCDAHAQWAAQNLSTIRANDRRHAGRGPIRPYDPDLRTKEAR